MSKENGDIMEKRNLNQISASISTINFTQTYAEWREMRFAWCATTR